MASSPGHDAWVAEMARDPARRAVELRRAVVIEITFSLVAAAFAILSVWGFTTTDATVGGLASDRIGGLAVLCFGACMAIAAGGGIKKRLITLADALDSRRS